MDWVISKGRLIVPDLACIDQPDRRRRTLFWSRAAMYLRTMWQRFEYRFDRPCEWTGHVAR